MRIAVVTPFYKPSIGGVEYIVYHTARELSRRGFEVHVVTTTHDNRWRRIASQGASIEEGVYVHRLEPSRLRVGYATIMRGLKEVLAEIKPDIVHCHNLHPHLFQSMKWKSELGYRLVAQLHHPMATGIDHLAARLLYKFVMKRLVKEQGKIDAFIAHTAMERQWLASEGIDESRIRVVRYPCIPDELTNYRANADIHDRLSANTVITYISRIHPRKGQHLLVRASLYLRQELSDFRIYIAGPASDEQYLRELHAYIERFDLKKYVVIDPRPLPESEKLDAIATSDVFAYTPLKDYTPVTVLEALALRTPLVATGVGAIPEMLSVETVLGELTKDIEPGRVKALFISILEEKLKDSDKAVSIVGTNPREIAKGITRIHRAKRAVHPGIFIEMVKPYLSTNVVNALVKLYGALLQM